MRIENAPLPEIVYLDGFYILGISDRTNNKFEMQGTGKIPLLWESFNNKVVHEIANKPNPAVTVGTYSDYEKEMYGEYTVTVGIKFPDPVQPPSGFVVKIIPPGKYAKFTSRRGALPAVVIEGWLHMWSLSPTELGGVRSFTADLEVYDEKAEDPKFAAVDLYMALKG